MPEPMIEVIPAIDVQDGVAVRARMGLRQSYVPLKTPLTCSSAPQDVVAGLLTLHPFRKIYIADLDRIERRGSNEQCLEELRRAFPALAYWVDAGISDAAEAHAWLARHGQAHLVLGSETVESLTVLEDLALGARTLLSLDYRGDVFLGPGEIWDKPQLCPARVVFMPLARVWTHAGRGLHHPAARSVHDNRTENGCRRVPVTASIGCKTFRSPPDSSADALQQADRLMYEAKSNGKNRAEHRNE